jgi:hypothetical protein
MTYYVITNAGTALAVALENPYSLGLSDVSIHEFEESLPDLNTHAWDAAQERFVKIDSKLTQVKFLQRFTPAEYAAIKNAAAVNSDLDYYWQLFMSAEYIDTTDALTIGGINMLASVGLIATSRVAEILS